MKKSNLIGKTFNELKVIGESKERIKNQVTWDCKCSCGEMVRATTKDLTLNRKKSCGHLRHEPPANLIDLTNKTFGKLKVIGKAESLKSTQEAKWHCLCKCGGEIDVLGSSLRNGRTKSCGCMLPPSKQILEVHKHIENDLTIENVRVPLLKMKIPSNNKTGVKGVIRRVRNNKITYEAYITLKYKRHHLGTFDNIEDAIKARKQGELKYHQYYIDELENKGK